MYRVRIHAAQNIFSVADGYDAELHSPGYGGGETGNVTPIYGVMFFDIRK